MLVLSRKAQEVIQIGDEITVTILRIKGRTVRVGIDAPEDMRVRRSELPPNEEQTETRSGSSISTFHRKFDNWPLNREQRLQLMSLAADA